jgi:eukaryotic-like serine/threonine-protein kinase
MDRRMPSVLSRSGQLTPYVSQPSDARDAKMVPMHALGPYQLEEVIGRGGMAEVWSAAAPGGRSVAVKVLTARACRDERFLLQFQDEVRAVAALDHPAIVAVYDHGIVDLAAQEASGGALTQGSPYLVMELATGGTLRPVRTFRSLERVLQLLLGALGHAHARGVLHRDLKPTNVLLTAGPCPIRLADFGVAHLFSNDSSRIPTAVGTPTYMAPEQVTGAWRDWGPWTDLYALGCIGWALTAGHSPFGFLRAELSEVLRAHISTAPPPFKARFPVPVGYEGWLRRLLDKSPYHRFATAADAQLALSRLDHGIEEEERPTDPALPRLDASLHDLETLLRAPVDDEPVPVAGRPVHHQPPLFPMDWRDEKREVKQQRLPALGLFGLRQPRMAGRISERDELWRALGRVVSGGTEVVQLQGAAGVGKTSLARWLTQLAHEVGAAQVLPGRFSDHPGPRHGLAAMAGRFLNTEGLKRAAVQKRVQTWWGLRAPHAADDVDAMVELLHPATEAAREAGLRAVRLESVEHQAAAVVGLIRAARRERPVVVLLDDAHLDGIADVLAGQLLDASMRGTLSGVLVVQTLLHPGSASNRTLRGRPHVHTVHLSPLHAQDTAALVRELLVLDPKTSSLIADRGGGNPLYTVQLVGDLVERGVLLRTADGFRTPRGARLSLPDSLHTLWRERTSFVLDHRPVDDRAALELAAAMGRVLSTDEWRKALVIADLAPTPTLVADLADQGLISVEPNALAFSHGLLRESLERQAREAGRWKAHNLAVGTMLLTIEAPRSAERAAHHLSQAAAWEMAIEPMRRAALDARQRGDLAITDRLCQQRIAALEGTGVPSSDQRYGETWLLSSIVARSLGDLNRAVIIMERGLEVAREHDWTGLMPALMVELANVKAIIGDLDRAEAILDEAKGLAAASGDTVAEADADGSLGWVYFVLGRIDEAEPILESAIACIRSYGPDFRTLEITRGLAAVYLRQGKLVDASRVIDDALELARARGWRPRQAHLTLLKGEIARMKGDRDGALALYREGRGVLHAIGVSDVMAADLSIGTVLLELGKFEEAAAVLEPLATTFSERLLGGHAAAAHLCLLSVDAWREDWAAWRTHFEAMEATLGVSPLRDPDVATLSVLAADLAAERSAYQAAREAYRFALKQWKALGNEGEVERVRARLAALPRRSSWGG